MQSGQLIPLNIPLEGKTIAIHSECRHVNWAISKCKQMQSFESLFDAMGMSTALRFVDASVDYSNWMLYLIFFNTL